ncbi:hypothetical protein D3C71_947360 [compost metagenome]
MQRNLCPLQQAALLVGLRSQFADTKGLTDRQPEQSAQQRIAERLVEYPAQHQANQHQHPLHGRYP